MEVAVNHLPMKNPDAKLLHDFMNHIFSIHSTLPDLDRDLAFRFGGCKSEFRGGDESKS